jgi:hypothetical protein
MTIEHRLCAPGGCPVPAIEAPKYQIFDAFFIVANEIVPSPHYFRSLFVVNVSTVHGWACRKQF